MTTQLDYYRILQVHPNAEKEVIDAAYRKLAAKYHPDVSQVANATERMKQINTAYEVLSDPVKRVAYDAVRGVATPPDAPSQAGASPSHHSQTWRRWMIAVSLMLLAGVVFRVAPALLFVLPKLVVPLGAFFLVVWLFRTLTKPRR